MRTMPDRKPAGAASAKQRDGIVRAREACDIHCKGVRGQRRSANASRGFFTDGRVLTWEYPHATPDASRWTVEIMEIEHG